jgi:hypothetical protein
MNLVLSNITTGILAQGPDTNGFQNSALWGMIQTLGQVAGVLVVLAGIFKIASTLLSGKASGAMKIALGTIVAAAFLFNLNLLFDFLGSMTGLVQAIFDGITSIFGGEKSAS